MPSWLDHDRDCPRRHPQTDEFRCTCGVDDQVRAAAIVDHLRSELEIARLKKLIRETNQ